VSEPVAQPALGRSLALGAERRVVMVASAGAEPSLDDVVTNLATVCAQIGQRVALLSTAGLASPGAEAELPQSTPLWWKQWPSPGNGAELPTEEERGSLLSGPLKPTDVENLLGETGVPGVSRLDLRYFVGHPVQVVIRVPEVLAALREVVDVVFLDVLSLRAPRRGTDTDGRRGAGRGRARDDHPRRNAAYQCRAEAPQCTRRRHGTDRRWPGNLRLGARRC